MSDLLEKKRGYPAIEIHPHNWNGFVTAKAIKIRESIKALVGLNTQKQFVEFLQGADDELSDYEGAKKLEKFWQGRYYNEEFNAQMEILLDKLKAE